MEDRERMNKNTLASDISFIKENLRLIIPEITPISRNTRLRFEQIGDKLNFILNEYCTSCNSHCATRNPNRHTKKTNYLQPHEYKDIAIAQLIPSIFKG